MAMVPNCNEVSSVIQRLCRYDQRSCTTTTKHQDANSGAYRRCTVQYALRKISEPTRDGETGKRRRLHNEELNALYSTPNIIRVIKSRRVRWAGHVAVCGTGPYRILVGILEGGKPPEDFGVDMRIILK
jgi:hypothetical protein